LFVVANKTDLFDQREITTKEGLQYAALHKAEYFEVSAKTGINVKEAFQYVLLHIYERKRKFLPPQPQATKPEPKKETWGQWFSKYCTLI